MSGPEPPPTEARLHGWLFYSIYRFCHILLPSLPAARRGPPQAPALVTLGKVSLKTLSHRDKDRRAINYILP